MLKCPFCHFENEDGALFCEQCKSDLGLAEPAVASEIGPGTGGLSPLEGHALSAAPDPITPLAADVVSEPHVVETIPMAELASAGQSTVTDEAQVGDYPVVETVPMAAPVAETAGEPPPVAVPIATPVHAEEDKTATGTSTQTDGAVAAAPIPLPAGAKPKLVVVRGLKVNAEYPLYEGDNYIGRADEKPVDVDLEEQEAPDRVWSSRQHALITFEEGNLAIEDLNSMNGTFVNRTRVHPGQKRPLQVNDVIQVGTVHMKVKI
ncbi:MAG TPA: FHA domain-containing protein [Gemmataceae bacterium]|nr:FHA domain-containing protein [Gemmataceae bacterium]